MLARRKRRLEERPSLAVKMRRKPTRVPKRRITLRGPRSQILRRRQLKRARGEMKKRAPLVTPRMRDRRLTIGS